MKQLSKVIISGLFLPIVLFIDILKSERPVLRKIGYLFLVLFIFVSIWWNCYRNLVAFINYTLFEFGITDKITKVKVVGTSMLPTIIDGSEVTLNSPKKYGLERGDIVSFSNNETAGLFYIKRIIGMPGEKIYIKNGYYYINDKMIEEDYTLNHLPTFGNTFLADCESVTIPKDDYFVSGDNRTVSTDSRIIGFINKDDIEGVIKTKVKQTFDKQKKQSEMFGVEISPKIFLQKLNTKRQASKISLLVTHQTLNDLAKKRTEQIMENFDDWKNNNDLSSDVSIDKLLEKSDYHYNLVHEFVTFGYLSEDNIIDQIFESVIQKDAFLSSKFTEVGIGLTERTFGECKYPIISVILSWPTLPTYDQSVVDSWSKEIGYTNELLSNMQSWVGSKDMDQGKVRKVISLAAEQNDIAERIYNKQKDHQWLSDKDYQDIKLYDELVVESNKLVEELFGSNTDVKGVNIREDDVRRF